MLGSYDTVMYVCLFAAAFMAGWCLPIGKRKK
jgi:hypothetical protein